MDLFLDELLPAVTAADVIAERTRRLTLGFDFDFADGRGVHRIGTTAEDRAGWQEVTDATGALVALGNGSATLMIVTDTGPVEISANEWQQILVAAASARQPVWQASFALQAMDPIPRNFADDSYWP